VNASFDTTWGYVVSLVAISESIWVGLFGDAERIELPVAAAWTVAIFVCLACIALLSRKIRAYEVVS